MDIKIQIVEELSVNRLNEIIRSLIIKEGYSDVTKEKPNIISSKITSGLSKLNCIFYLYNNPLSGQKINLKSITDKIKIDTAPFNPSIITIISNYNISNSVEKKLKNQFGNSLHTINRTKLIKLIDKQLNNFWTYENFDLVDYEKYFLDEMSEKPALLNIQGLEKKARKLLNIYIKPRIYQVKKDIESKGTQLNRVNENEIIRRGKSSIIEGDTGSGKSTLLKELGKIQIKNQTDLKTLPLYISPLSLLKSKLNIKNVTIRLLRNKIVGEFEDIITSYKLLLLIDNLDEFDENEQNHIIEQLNDLSKNKNIRFIITTRSLKTGDLETKFDDVDIFQIRKFNDRQIKEFATRFFDDHGIAKNLLEALEDYRILQRLPLTPLSLSLIALVYEKENYEIPATISDIYNNFNSLILGKLTATKKFELINFSFRERILSIYALEILNNKNRPFNKDRFYCFFIDYFKEKSSNVNLEVIEEFLNYIIDKSGILRIYEDDYINFTHKSFLEYYASIEIFKHQRKLESKLVNEFLDLNWQNVAIFYAGQSKDMPDFLNSIIERVEKSEMLDEHYNAIMGLGYLLQALYQTDNKLRKKATILALNQNLIVHEWSKKLISNGEILFFKNMKLPALSIFNMYFFYLNFLSSTLSEPLKMTFEDLLVKYKANSSTTLGYQLLTIAAIFHSKRLNDSSYLEKLMDETNIMKDAYLLTIAEHSLYFDSSDYHKELKKELNKSYQKMDSINKELLSKPASKLRFSNLDLIESNKKVTIITEGVTDVEIIEHAYNILTRGKVPYWKIKPADANGSGSGGAKEVKFILDKAYNIVEKTEVLIGLFDSDQEGLNQFDGLKFDLIENNKRVKKLKNNNIYGLKLPVPENKKQYLLQEREHQYFVIEHYFEKSILEAFNLVIESGIPGLFKINPKGKKTNFSKYIRSIKEPQKFIDFIPLFETIDEICGIGEIDYYNEI